MKKLLDPKELEKIRGGVINDSPNMICAVDDNNKWGCSCGGSGANKNDAWSCECSDDVGCEESLRAR